MITEKQKKAVDLVFKCYKTREIAAELGIHRTTLWRWFQKPEMQAYYDARFRKRMKRRVRATIRRLEKLMDCDDKEISYNAANAILDFASIAWKS